MSRIGTKPLASPVFSRNRAKPLAPEAESPRPPHAIPDAGCHQPLTGVMAALFLTRRETPPKPNCRAPTRAAASR